MNALNVGITVLFVPMIKNVQFVYKETIILIMIRVNKGLKPLFHATTHANNVLNSGSIDALLVLKPEFLSKYL